MLFHKLEMLDHRVGGERAELAGNAQHHRFRVRSLELDLALAEIGFDAGQRAEEIVIPEGAAEFAVGDGLQADLFLLLDDRSDFAVLDCFERVGGDLVFLRAARARLSAPPYAGGCRHDRRGRGDVVRHLHTQHSLGCHAPRERRHPVTTGLAYRGDAPGVTGSPLSRGRTTESISPTPLPPARRSSAASPTALLPPAHCPPRSRQSRIAATDRADRARHILSLHRCGA